MQRIGSRVKGTQRVGSRVKGTQRVGSRAQVMHGNAKMTGGGLRKKDLKYNKHGKIVSKKMSQRAKKEKRLQKAGYTTIKGQFGAVRSMRGGATPNRRTRAICASDKWLTAFRETQDAVTELNKIIPLGGYELFTRGDTSSDNPFNAVYIGADVIKVGLIESTERDMTKELLAYEHLKEYKSKLNSAKIFFPELLGHGRIGETKYMYIQIEYITGLKMVEEEDKINYVEEELNKIRFEHGDPLQNVYSKDGNIYIIDFEASSIESSKNMNLNNSCTRSSFISEELQPSSPESPYLGRKGRRIMYMSSPNSNAEAVTPLTPAPARTPAPAPEGSLVRS